MNKLLVTSINEILKRVKSSANCYNIAVNEPLIYLDHAAATPIDERVLAAMQPYFSNHFFNPSSPYQPALAVKKNYRSAKDTLASCIGAKGDELVMTAGATESINLAFSVVTGHVVSSAIEHDAVLQATKQHEYTLVQVDKYGRISPEDIRGAIRPDTQLVSIQLANNEIGTIQPLKDIASVVKNERQKRLDTGNSTPIFLHCDASQGIGLLEVNIARLGVDMLTLNSGKMYGPKQVGLLWADRRVRLTAQIVGGGQESGLRSGTENVAGVVGFARALELASKSRKNEVERLGALRDLCQNILIENFPAAIISGHQKHQLSSFLHISFPGIDAERLVFLLEARGVMVATGSACAANKGTRSHVLTAIGLTSEDADGSLRLTFGHLSDDINTKRAADIISEEVTREYKRVLR